MKSNSFLRYAFRVLFSCVLITMFWGVASANNIRIIGKPILTDQDTIKNTVLIKFDIAWDNSWKTSKPANHDAAWIFVKCWDGESWNHVYLDKDGAVAGNKTTGGAVNKGVTYSVTNRDGSVKTMDMKLEPGYSYAWKKWHLDPAEDSVQCIVGYFLYRDGFGAGHVVVPGVTFKWNYGEQGFVDEDDLVVKVFAVEMVYVPEGAYYLGGKGTASYQHNSFTTNGATFGAPMVITSENAIEIKNDISTSTLWAVGNAITAGTLSKDFPKGYKAFYIMKYEMTQEAYVEFLNTMNQGQQDGRVQASLNSLVVNSYAWGSDVSAYRYYIKVKQAAPVVIFGCDANGNNKYDETDKVKYDYRDTLVRNIDGQDLAMVFVSWMDLLAYAEFAGLRPMTELEYEKACRGTREPVNDEYAWGSVTMTFWFPKTTNQWPYNMLDFHKGTERPGDSRNAGAFITNSWWNSNPYPLCGPIRVGCFADSTTTRAASGATFWGVMNMSDNPAEMCVSVYDNNGRVFDGTHGCGQLDGNGDAVNKNWLQMTKSPSAYINRGMFFTNGNYTGGIYAINHLCGMVSNRYRFNHGQAVTARDYTASGMRGIRCVRTVGTQK